MTEISKPYPIDEVLQKKTWSLPQAYAYCLRLARRHYENFPVGSVLIPKAMRPHVCAVYAFARRADDIADEDFPEADRIPALEAWQQLLESSLNTRVNHPVFLALKETISLYQLPPQLLIDLITAFKMDVQIKRHPTFDDLLFYCRHSANPVGRLVLHLFGYRDERLMLLSDKICTALQLANFWQDVSVDIKKNRIYVPLEDVERFSYSEAQFFAFDFNKNFQDLLKFQVDRTEQLFREGAALVSHLKGRLRLEIKCVTLGGMAVLQKIRELDYNTLAIRPTLKKQDKAAILLRALFRFRHATSVQRKSPNKTSLNASNSLNGVETLEEGGSS